MEMGARVPVPSPHSRSPFQAPGTRVREVGRGRQVPDTAVVPRPKAKRGLANQASPLFISAPFGLSLRLNYHPGARLNPQWAPFSGLCQGYA